MEPFVQEVDLHSPDCPSGTKKLITYLAHCPITRLAKGDASATMWKRRIIWRHVAMIMILISLVQFMILISDGGETTPRFSRNSPPATRAPLPSISTVKNQMGESIWLMPHDSNLPFMDSYVNATLAFKGYIPPSLKDWKPPKNSYQHFQSVSNTDTWIYSAFSGFVEEVKPAILILGMSRGPISMFKQIGTDCHFESSGTNESILTTSIGKAKQLPDHHSTLVYPVMIACLLPATLTPTYVSVAWKANRFLTNRLKILYPGGKFKRNFTVCYSPFHSNFDDTDRFIHSLQFNTLLGADHFFVYNFSISTRMDKLLHQYEAQGSVTILQWPIPTLEVWYIGQVASLNDCLYRNKGVSKFVVFVDTDEFIVPRDASTWAEMISLIEFRFRFLSGVKRQRGEKWVPIDDRGDFITGNGSLNGITSLQKRRSVEFTPKVAGKKKPLSYLMNEYMQLINCSQPAIYTFRTAIFVSNKTSKWLEIEHDFNITDSEGDLIGDHRVFPLLHHLRQKDVFPHFIKSKMIVRTSAAREIGIHLAPRYNPDAGDCWVSEKTAIVHHYRNIYEAGEYISDPAAFRFKDQLTDRLKKEFSRLNLL